MKQNQYTKITIFLAAALTISWFALPNHSPFHSHEFSRLPVIEKGRVKSFDTVARSSLLFIQGKQKVRQGEESLRPIDWLLKTIAKPAEANQLKIFKITHSGVLNTLGLSAEDGKYHSYQALAPSLETLIAQAQNIEKTPSQQRSPYQRGVMALTNRLLHYESLQRGLFLGSKTNNLEQLSAFATLASQSKDILSGHGNRQQGPKMAALLHQFKRYKAMAEASNIRIYPAGTDNWHSMGDAILSTMTPAPLPEVTRLYTQLFEAYQKTDVQLFNTTVEALKTYFQAQAPATYKTSALETRFNEFSFFYKALVIYVIVILMVLYAWLFRSDKIIAMAGQLTFVAFLLHTAGIVLRMFIQARPPVTNLYSSAIFVGWAAILMGLVFEKVNKKGVGLIVAGTCGYLTLIIAHHLSLANDTLEMMQAVLDTNFWLATHVVIITLGYAATIVAGLLAHFYIFKGILSKTFSTADKKNISKMVYAANCAAILFMFIGTVLGGIWADQSWGRFWGWDPKENGALLIVLWLSILLHARLGGFIKAKGLMVMSIFSNIVTSFSWFGVNMLGIGLHSYGFMESTFLWLMLFIFTQLFMIWLAFLPERYWRSCQT